MPLLRPICMRCLVLFLLCCVPLLTQTLSAEDEYPEEFFEPVDEQPQPDEDGTPMLGVYMGGHGDDGDGVVIVGVIPGTAADRMGLQNGDVIRSVNGRPIDSQRTLVDVVINSGIGENVAVDVTRGGAPHSFSDNFSKRPERFGDINPDHFRGRDRMGRHKRPQSLMKRLFDAMRNAKDEEHQRRQNERELHKARQELDQHSPLTHALQAFQALHNSADFNFHFIIDVDSADFSAAQHAEKTSQQPVRKHAVSPPSFMIQASCAVDADHL